MSVSLPARFQCTPEGVHVSGPASDALGTSGLPAAGPTCFFLPSDLPGDWWDELAPVTETRGGEPS